jgi:hypothetical protein
LQLARAAAKMAGRECGEECGQNGGKNVGEEYEVKWREALIMSITSWENSYNNDNDVSIVDCLYQFVPLHYRPS